MGLRRLTLLLILTLLVAPCAHGHHRWQSRNPSGSVQVPDTAGRTVFIGSSRSRPFSLSPLALAAYRLKSEREETESLIARESEHRRLPLLDRFSCFVVQVASSNPSRAIIPLRC
jgi:hypothetical protein